MWFFHRWGFWKVGLLAGSIILSTLAPAVCAAGSPLEDAYEALERLEGEYARTCIGKEQPSRRCQSLRERIENLKDEIARYIGGESLRRRIREVMDEYRRACPGGKSNLSEACRNYRRRLAELLEALRKEFSDLCSGEQASSSECKEMEALIEELEALLEGSSTTRTRENPMDVGGIDLSAARLGGSGPGTASDGDILLFQVQTSFTLPSRALDSAADLVRASLAAGISVPNGAWWVNLNPSEPDRIADPRLPAALQEVLLVADLNLKRSLGRLTDPRNSSEARRYWALLREEHLSGRSLPSGVRVWVSPGKMVVESDGKGRFRIAQASLQVMTETQYSSVRGGHGRGTRPGRAPKSEEFLQEVLLPRLRALVNEDPLYAPLRQAFQGLVLARAMAGERTARVASLGSAALSPSSGWTPRHTWKDYLASLRLGEYSFCEETQRQEGSLRIIESTCYFSGGVDFTEISPHLIPMPATTMSLLDKSFSASSILRTPERAYVGVRP